MRIEDLTESKTLQAMKLASKIAEEQGIADMTLEDINTEIAAARKDDAVS